jgi:hypothetical protein
MQLLNQEPYKTDLYCTTIVSAEQKANIAPRAVGVTPQNKNMETQISLTGVSNVGPAINCMCKIIY